MTVHGQQLRHFDRYDGFVSEAERQHRGSSDFIRQCRPEPDPLRGDERRRDGHDDGIGRHRAERGFDRKTFSAMIDQYDGTVEPNRQACRLRRDYGAVSFSDPPVDAGIGITAAVLHRDKIEFDTVDITADRIEERIKAAIGFEKLRRAAVCIVGADRFEAVVEAP